MNRYSKVDGQTIMYDGRGNMTDDGTATYSYNMLNQQVSATVAGQTTQYLYDALGRRIGKLQNGVTTRYIHDLRQQVLEEHRNGSLHARLTYGANIDDPLTLEQGGQTYHYHQDALGNVTELSNSSGAVVERYKYNTYGKVSITNGSDTPLASSAVGNEVLFNGRRYNPETNTYHYRARVYNPEWGQFLQRDTIDPGLLGSGPQGHNRYSYVMNNPTRFRDPSGHLPSPREIIRNINTNLEKTAQLLHDTRYYLPLSFMRDVSPDGELGSRSLEFSREFRREIKEQLPPDITPEEKDRILSDAQNAARHAHWQASIVDKYGMERALQADAANEATFRNYEDPAKIEDTLRDFINNGVGRDIGAQLQEDSKNMCIVNRDGYIRNGVREAWDNGRLVTDSTDLDRLYRNQPLRERNVIEKYHQHRYQRNQILRRIFKGLYP